MAHTHAYVTDQPVIATDSWPLRIEFDDGAVWVTVNGDKPEQVAW